MAIENISDTARWVAVYRAMESARPDAIFRDAFAAKLAGERGVQIVDSMKRGRQMGWAMIVRTAVFDEMILAELERHGIDLVLNLAAGLDARPWRLALPPSLRWIDVDLPAILEYKRETIGDAKPRCIYEAAPTDLTDAVARRALFARAGSEARRALVVTEGLLIYLTAEQVGALAADLHAVPSMHAWIFDLARPRLLEMMQKSWGKALQRGNAPFRFAPEEGTAFFRPFGWAEAEFRSSMEEARRLHREMKLMWLWRFLGKFSSKERKEEFRRFSGVVRMERA